MTMPALSPTMTQGTIDSYNVSVGDEVGAGDSLATIRTDKAAMEFETQDEGFIAWIDQSLVGKVTPVGQICMIIVEEAADLEKFKDFSPSHAADSGNLQGQASADNLATNQQHQGANNEIANEPTPVTTSGKSADFGQKVFISPRALKKLESQGFNKQTLQTRIEESNCPLLKGSGPNNRIIEQDIDNVVKSLKITLKTPKAEVAAPAQKDTSKKPPLPLSGQVYKEIELSTMRRVIADRLSESKREIPHYYLEREIKMDSLLAFKKEIFENTGVKLSVNDFIVKAVAKACQAVPETNTHFVNGKIRQFEAVDVR